MKRIYVFLILVFVVARISAQKCLDGKCYNGFGTYESVNGSLYTGCRSTGKLCNFSYAKSNDGRITIGWFYQNQIARGYLIDTTSWGVYKGQFKEGLPDGYGVYAKQDLKLCLHGFVFSKGVANDYGYEISRDTSINNSAHIKILWEATELMKAIKNGEFECNPCNLFDNNIRLLNGTVIKPMNLSPSLKNSNLTDIGNTNQVKLPANTTASDKNIKTNNKDNSLNKVASTKWEVNDVYRICNGSKESYTFFESNYIRLKGNDWHVSGPILEDLGVKTSTEGYFYRKALLSTKDKGFGITEYEYDGRFVHKYYLSGAFYDQSLEGRLKIYKKSNGDLIKGIVISIKNECGYQFLINF